MENVRMIKLSKQLSVSENHNSWATCSITGIPLNCNPFQLRTIRHQQQLSGTGHRSQPNIIKTSHSISFVYVYVKI